MGIGFIFSQIKRLLSRNLIDIAYFCKYYLFSFPIRISDRFPTKEKISFSEGMKHDIGSHVTELPEELVIFTESLGAFGKSIVDDGSINLLGQKIDIGWPPKWETTETGHFSKGASNSIEYFGKDRSVDIKLIWELHRMQWFPAVAAYARENNDEELASAIADIFLEYWEMHPYGKTVAWMEGIEVSIRAISVIISISTLRELVDNRRKTRINYWLGLHGEWINSHLSRKWRVNNNHLLVELIGLGIIGMQLSSHPNRKKWINRSKRILGIEIRKQTIDGRNWEPTTAYHRFVTEAILVFLSFESKQDSFSKENKDVVWDYCSDMVKTLTIISDQDGVMPLIGDDDGGRILPSNGKYNVRSVLDTVKLAKLLDFDVSKPLAGTKIWNDLGMGVLWGDSTHASIVSGAPRGPIRQASHRHLDMLSISLRINSMDVLLDCGTGLYFGNSNFRNWFRGEGAHSGIFSEKKQWGKIRDLFEITNPSIGYLEPTNHGIIAKCETNREEYSTREISLRAGKIKIEDELCVENPVVNFVLPYSVDLIEKNDEIIIAGDEFRITHSPIPEKIVILSEFNNPKVVGVPSPECAVVSRGYGTYNKCKIIRMKHSKNTTTETYIKVDS